MWTIKHLIVWLFSLLSVVGYAAQQAKIINGQPVAEYQAPWQVALVSNSQQPYTSYFCSANILSDKWLVTAAHCAERSNGKPFYAVIGTTDLLNSQTAQRILIKQRLVYPKYNPSNFDNDIALLELVQPIDFIACDQACKSINWINAHDEALYAVLGVKTWIHGWGVIRDCKQDIATCDAQEKTFEALYPAKLQGAELKIVHCLAQGSLHNPQQITPSMMCADSINQEKPSDTCEGDSGSSLIMYNNVFEPVLLGLTSWGNGCAQQGYAGVYTRLAAFDDWLKSTVYPESIPKEVEKPIETQTPTTENATIEETKSGSSVWWELLILLALVGFKRRR
ncbi:MAG: serine protease [Moraxellaceae bacterium]|nr:serine protease [Moraxellaceae bacterium]